MERRISSSYRKRKGVDEGERVEVGGVYRKLVVFTGSVKMYFTIYRNEYIYIIF